MSESVKAPETKAPAKKTQAVTEAKTEAVLYVCLLYTSDAADD